jgi:hypothetical protein
VPGLIHATAATNWSLSGSMLTFAFPMVLFILAALVLYRLLWWPHRIPGHSDLVPASTAPPEAGTAHVMAAAAGMTAAAGAGAQPLPHEPHGATEVAEPKDAEVSETTAAEVSGPKDATAAEPAEAGRDATPSGPEPGSQPPGAAE